MIFHNINPVLLDLGSLQIRYYGLIYAIGFLIAFYTVKKLSQDNEKGIAKKDIEDLLIYSIVGIVLGARIGYVLFYNFSFFMQNPLTIFAVWNGGLSFHGGFVGIILSTLLFCKRKKYTFYQVTDLLVIPTGLALALGRIANFINAELFGRMTQVPWCIDYSQNQYMASPPDGCRHPSQLYESFYSFGIFAFLLYLYKYKLKPGILTWSFVALYGLSRTLAEFFRQPDPQLGFVLGSLSMGQLLSIPMIAVGAIMVYKIQKSN